MGPLARPECLFPRPPRACPSHRAAGPVLSRLPECREPLQPPTDPKEGREDLRVEPLVRSPGEDLGLGSASTWGLGRPAGPDAESKAGGGTEATRMRVAGCSPDSVAGDLSEETRPAGARTACGGGTAEGARALGRFSGADPAAGAPLSALRPSAVGNQSGDRGLPGGSRPRRHLSPALGCGRADGRGGRPSAPAAPAAGAPMPAQGAGGLGTACDFPEPPARLFVAVSSRGRECAGRWGGGAGAP